MRRAALLAALLPALGGCTTVALRDHTARTANSLTDLHYRQVLDNVARFHDSPDTVPSFAVVTAGTVSVNDQASAGVSPTYAPTLTPAQQGGGPVILQLLFPFAAQRSLAENWSLTPVTDADHLRRLRCAYRLLVAGNDVPDGGACREQLADFFPAAADAPAGPFPPRGWYRVGGKRDVPRDACHVGRHGDTYAWVAPGGVNGLALFTLGVLDLATGKPHAPRRAVVRRYAGDTKPENLVETTVATTEDDAGGREAVRQGRVPPPPRDRIGGGLPPNPGLYQLPRP